MTGVKKDDNGRGVGYFQDQVPRLEVVFKVKSRFENFRTFLKDGCSVQ